MALPYRRYCLLKRLAHAAVGDDELASHWQYHQAAAPGTALPSDFPARTALAAAGYSTFEDLSEATLRELRAAGLSYADARAVLAALG